KLNDVKTLAFHIVSEVDNGDIKTEDDFYKWFERSLAFQQGNALSKSTCTMVFNKLRQSYMIFQDEKTGHYQTTMLGKISAKMYQNPFTVYDWFSNFLKVQHVCPFGENYLTLTTPSEIKRNEVDVCLKL